MSFSMEGDEVSIVAFFHSATTTTKQNYIALSLSLQAGV